MSIIWIKTNNNYIPSFNCNNDIYKIYVPENYTCEALYNGDETFGNKLFSLQSYNIRYVWQNNRKLTTSLLYRTYDTHMSTKVSLHKGWMLFFQKKVCRVKFLICKRFFVSQVMSLVFFVGANGVQKILTSPTFDFSLRMLHRWRWNISKEMYIRLRFCSIFQSLRQ